MSKKKHKKSPVKKAASKKPVEKKSFWKKLLENRGLTATVAALAVVLVVVLIVVLVQSGKKDSAPKGPSVQISADFQHEIPKEFDENDYITMKNETTATVKDYLRVNGGYSADIPPKFYEKGWYIFDDDGIARKYRDLEGNIHNLPKEEQIEHTDVVLQGAPLLIVGDVKMHYLIYKDAQDLPAACYLYFTLSDKNDMEYLLNALVRCGMENPKQVSDTVAEVVWDATKIANLLQKDALEASTDVTAFMGYLGQTFGVTR